MPGRFYGLTDEQWKIIEPLFPEPPEPGQSHAPFRDLLNTILWVLITGARWADIPDEKGFGKRSRSHRRLGIWKSDGNGNPLSVISTDAAAGEREQIEPLIESVKVRTGRRGRPEKRPSAIQADKRI